MMHARFPRWIVAFIILSLGFVQAARAEPIVVTGGGWDQDTGDPPGAFTLIGGNFELILYPYNVTSFGHPLQCGGCAPGTPIDLTFGTAGVFNSVNRSIGGAGSARSTINGVTYTNLFFEASLNWNVPTISATTGRQVAPFSFTGSVAAFTNPERTGPSLFSGDLIGQGEVVLVLEGEQRLLFDAVSYTFVAAATPTPEPASLLLIGSGLLFSGFKVRATRKRSST